jgi:DNA-directed RNA polymerase specialized sigma24 family protein
MASSNASLLRLSDADIVSRMKYSDEDGLRALLLVHGPKVRGFLERRHGYHVAAEAINESALLIFVDKINTYNPAKGSLGPWFLRIAHRKAIDIRKGEDRKTFARLEFDPKDDPAECDDSSRSSATCRGFPGS